MPANLSYPHVLEHPGKPATLQRIPRLRIAQVAMDHVFYGWSAEDILRQHEFLTPAEVHAALGFYFDHREEIDREIAAEVAQAQADLNESSKGPLAVRLRALRFGIAA